MAGIFATRPHTSAVGIFLFDFGLQVYHLRVSNRFWESLKAQRACGNKRRFASEKHCLGDIAKQKAEVKLYAYQCKLCGSWHKTKQEPPAG